MIGQHAVQAVAVVEVFHSRPCPDGHSAKESFLSEYISTGLSMISPRLLRSHGQQTVITGARLVISGESHAMLTRSSLGVLDASGDGYPVQTRLTE